jgi:competence protein ComEC
VTKHSNFKHQKLKAVFLLFSLILSITLISGNVSASPSSHRLAGYTQYDTSSAIAKEGWTQSDYAILAYGENFPDALAAAPLAKKYNAPILLTERLTLTPVIEQTLQDLKVRNVYIVGGTAVISSTVENRLRDMAINVTRLAGHDQYDTAIEIAKQLGVSQEVSVVTGTDFADALSIASVSATKNDPIILVPKDYLPDSVNSYLSTNTITHSFIVGNADQISETVSSKFPNAERITGTDKYSRNIEVLNKFDSKYDFGTVFVATGNGFADALSGTAYAAKISAPIILVDKNTLSSETQDYVNSKLQSVKNLRILGGEAVISSSLESAMLGTPSSNPTGQNLKVSYINVGQGDSILIQTPTGKNVLIDGGKSDQATTIENYLHSAGVSTLDDVIATHADSDHIGSLDSIIKDFNIGKVYMPNVTNTTYTFEDLLTAMKSKGLTFNKVKAGGNLDLGTGIGADFVGPVKDSYTEENNCSAVLHLTYGSTSFLFTGDAETESENDMIASGANLKSTVLKVGHHGSASSTSEAFLSAVNPKYAVISVGPNSYGHPTEEVLDRLSKHGVSVYRTDISGTIVASSDGTSVTFNADPSTSIPSTPTTSLASSSTAKIATIDLVKEIVTITNTGAAEVDLTGWKLVSEEGNQTFNFPSGAKIPAGGSINIVSGPNVAAGPNTLLWTNSNVWNNSGDPGILYNSQGQVISRFPQ